LSDQPLVQDTHEEEAYASREQPKLDSQSSQGEELFVEFLELEEEPAKDKELTADG
jgi:hypothetical protein